MQHKGLPMLKEYYFKFENGAIRKMTESGAARFSKDIGFRIIDCNEDGDFKNNKRIKDGFTPGWQPNINKYVTCYQQYKRIVKDMGSEEMGNYKGESIEVQAERKRQKLNAELFDYDSLREIANEFGGLDLSDGEVRELKESV